MGRAGRANGVEVDPMSEAQMNDSVSHPSDEPPSDQLPLVDFIRERPWACVLAAAALGFVVARLVRGER